METLKARDYLNLAAQAHIKILFKQSLEILEDIRVQHDMNFRKLLDTLPEQYKGLIIQANYMDDDGYQHFRKRILDAGNSTARALDNEISKFSIDFSR